MLTNYKPTQSLRSGFIQAHNRGRRIPMFEDIGKVTPATGATGPAESPSGPTGPSGPPEPTTVKTEVVKTGDKVIIGGVEYLTQAKVNELVGTARTEGRDAGKQEVADEAKTKALQEQGNFRELYEKEQTKVSDLAAKVATMELERSREKVAAKHNIPTEMADRLKGTTEAELEADAKLLAKSLGNPRKPADTEGGAGTHKGGTGKPNGPKLNPPAWKQPGDVSWNKPDA